MPRICVNACDGEKIRVQFDGGGEKRQEEIGRKQGNRLMGEQRGRTEESINGRIKRKNRGIDQWENKAKEQGNRSLEHKEKRTGESIDGGEERE